MLAPAALPAKYGERASADMAFNPPMRQEIAVTVVEN